ncbi:MAG: exodeoxyribonuclease V subunit alpha [Nitriliruptoraceae bacterium]|nr:exodeoxyribonuclease V subunit alpha [Nitriliruptoraceae bacterium]
MTTNPPTRLATAVTWPPPPVSPDDADTPHDPWTVQRSVATPSALRPFVDARLLTAADVHVALALTGLVDAAPSDEVLLATALAVRAPRRQHVCVDLTRVVGLLGDPDGTTTPADTALPWPDPADWRRQLAASPLVRTHPSGPEDGPASADVRDRDIRPLTLADDRLYLDRLWRDEQLVAASLHARARRSMPDVVPAALRSQLDALFDGAAPDRQRIAAATAVLRPLTVVAGGPGTGKTTTVARLLAVLDDQADAAGRPPPTWALAAPTGKAAARLTESLQEAAAALAERRGAQDLTVQRLQQAQARTLHATLGVRARQRTRFRHDRRRPIPADVVVVDETSMVSLALIARLLDALRRDARLVLLGDPEQLASVEAGSVLGDVVAAALPEEVDARPGGRAPASVPDPAPAHAPDDATQAAGDTGTERTRRETVGPAHLPEDAAPGLARTVVVLDRVHRFRGDSGIAAAAAAIQRGDVGGVLRALEQAEDLTWIRPGEAGETDGEPGWWDPIRTTVLDVGVPMVEAARAGDVAGALAPLDVVRILCATRRGPRSVQETNDRVDRWIATATGTELRGRFPAGRPVLVTANDARLRVANGDVGIAVTVEPGRTMIAFPVAGDAAPRLVAPGRLPATEPLHAMTIHKSQGSQFEHVVVVLPDPSSPLASRELFYTALTRGRRAATVVADPDAIAAAVERRAVRASGLTAALRSRPARAIGR